VTIVWAGLAVGAVYALVAIGYNMPLSQSGTFNFAQGQLVVLGAFLAWFTISDHGWPWWAAALFGAAACGAIGFVEEIVAVRPVTRIRGGHGVLVTTVGASVVIEGILEATWGATPKSVAFFGGQNAFTLLGGRTEPVDLWLIVIAVIIAASMQLVSRYTAWGLGGRAANDNPEAAKAKGVNVTALRTTAFALAGALAGLLGPVIGPEVGVDVSVSITLTIFGFVALALGGFGSYLGCLIGGLAVGLIQACASRYLGVNYPPLILFGILLLILLLKPTGLFGRRALRAV
jgi:branched-chain amino acid transport system permease protein